MKAANQPMQETTSPLFLFFAVLFIACILSANIIAVKIISLFGFFVPAGIIIFPISYIIGDILTEVYGYENTKKIIWLGFFANLMMVIAIIIAQSLPAAPFWSNQKAFVDILGFAPRLLLASFTAFLIGSFANSFVMSKMKLMTKGNMLWTRTIGSTIVGEGLDSLIFISIAFIGSLPFMAIFPMILTQWFLKTVYEVIMTPVTYAIVGFLKKREKVDHFDYKVDYNPFAL
jgi:uncharacterized integral membrane protein (TIGR00697 family)